MKESSSTCTINTEMKVFMWENGWRSLDILSYTCTSNGKESVKFILFLERLSYKEIMQKELIDYY